MSVNVTTGSPGINPLNELVTRLVLGANTIDRGLMRVIPNQQNIVEIARMSILENQLTDLECTPTTPNDSISKDFVQIPTGGCQFYDTWCPEEDFHLDWSYLWATGRMTDSQAAPKVRAAILELIVNSVNANLEDLIWFGDTANASAWINRFDGYLKLMNADPSVIDVAGPVLTADNILAQMSATKNAANSKILEDGGAKFIVSYKDIQKLYDAQADGNISKGVNIMDNGVARVFGYEVVSCGIPENSMVFTKATSGADSNLLGATWMNADYKSAKIERLQANSSEWFGLMKFRFGVNYMYGSDISFYQGV